jgi:tRNA pseudouridine38-40 synthase
MVRNIVGTIVEAGSGRITLDEFMGIVEAKDRKRAGVKAPPQGLFLMMVRYEDSSLSGQSECTMQELCS